MGNKMKKFFAFFQQPSVGIIGSFASIISLFLAVYFYMESIQKKDLTYYIHPARTVIVSTETESKISVKYREKVIETDLSVATIAFWNAGDKEIKKEDFLSPFIIKTESGVPILDAKVLKKSRDAIKIFFNYSKKDSGLIDVSWNVLEKHDGAVLQIIYASDVKEKINLYATFIGQPSISTLKYPGLIKTPSEQYETFKARQKQNGFLMLFFAIFTLFFAFFSKRKLWKNEWKSHISLIDYIQPLVFFVWAFYELVIKSVPFPPFGF